MKQEITPHKFTREELAVATQPTRFNILKVVSAFKEIDFGRLANIVPQSKSSVSQHLTILAKHHFIERRKISNRQSYTDPKTMIISKPKAKQLLAYYFGYEEKDFEKIALEANSILKR